MSGDARACEGIIPATARQTILVVDDDSAMRTILGFTLGSFGYIALVAGDGEEALQVARKHPEIRMIILDVVMRGLSGKRLAEQLQIDLPKAAILFCSGHAAEALSLHGIVATSVHFMQKPCQPGALQRKIEELLGSG
ncbi:MAG TPA: response regulator [Chthoniobacterales bacterium]|nr:response regulator [Chthoniobacterales bacterium]